jgi:hypothetical protein
MLRALAREWRVCVVQFIKSDEYKLGEKQIVQRLGVEWVAGGDGFSWESEDLDQSAAVAAQTWALAAEKIASGAYRLVILDEITYPMNWGVARPPSRRRGDRPSPGPCQHRRHRARRADGARRAWRHGDGDGQGEARLRPRHPGTTRNRLLIKAR